MYLLVVQEVLEHKPLACISMPEFPFSHQQSARIETLTRDVGDSNKRLRRFVDDPARFSSLIGRYDALISGSFAVQFFERVMWHDSDLDLYVEDGPGYEALCKFVVDVEGYRPSNPTDLSSYEGKGLVEVHGSLRVMTLRHSFDICRYEPLLAPQGSA